SRASACISVSLRPRASVKTASWFPSSGTEVKTSTCTKGKRCLLFDEKLMFYPQIQFFNFQSLAILAVLAIVNVRIKVYFNHEGFPQLAPSHPVLRRLQSARPLS